ncbi:MAG: magnesium transporter CorA family protein [Clostridia bacterium]|nr:magnesium transporter CorA family protein [Deltaproteobacteria bacterium]
MLSLYVLENGITVKKRPWNDDGSMPKGVVWIDLLEPTSAEEELVEQALGLHVPTREEMEGIEFSSRFYQEDEALFMTATLLTRADTEEPENIACTFVLTKHLLLTLRYGNARAFSIYESRVLKNPGFCTSGELVLINLLETLIERMADVLEGVGRELENVSRMIFTNTHALGPEPGAPRMTRAQRRQAAAESNLQQVLRRLGRQGELVSKAQESIVSITRLLAYWMHVKTDWSEKSVREREKSVARDLRSLGEHALALSNKVSFLLDANLGLINIEQNNIIKLFSVVAVVFLPPTLIASIYGMNFLRMPELAWRLGYPMALVMMVGSAIAPYVYFKRRHWL